MIVTVSVGLTKDQNFEISNTSHENYLDGPKKLHLGLQKHKIRLLVITSANIIYIYIYIYKFCWI